MKNLALEPRIWIDLRSELEDQHLVSASLDYANRLFVLASLQPLDYRIIEPDGASFPRLKTKTPHDFVVYEATDQYSTSYSIPKQRWNYSFVQPLPDDELLLACGRSQYRGKDDFDLNARVFSHDGTFLRQFLLGDGIQHVQTTRSGSIWTSYFDEGVLGTYGWNTSIGESGLIEWDRQGNKKYTYQPSRGLDHIIDCYALNVVSEHEAWLYYYTEFPLVRLIDGRLDNFWQPPIRGAHHFAIWSDYVLFSGGYGDDQFHLFRFDGSKHMTKIATYSAAIKPGYMISRGSRIIMVNDNCFYQIDLAELARAI